jgi:type IV pilus assembly protein PilC
VVIIVSAILLIKVVPQFETVFASFGAELQPQFVIGISQGLQGMVVNIIDWHVRRIFRHQASKKKRRKKQYRNWIDRSVESPIVADII